MIDWLAEAIADLLGGASTFAQDSLVAAADLLFKARVSVDSRQHDWGPLAGLIGPLAQVFSTADGNLASLTSTVAPSHDPTRWWTEGRCRQPRPGNQLHRFKDGRPLPPDPCGQCATCELDEADQTAVAMKDARALCTLELRFGRDQVERGGAVPGEVLAAKMSRIRPSLGSVAWGWYCLEDADGFLIKAAVRPPATVSADVDGWLEQATTSMRTDGGTLAAVTRLSPEDLERRFLAELRDLRAGSLDMAEAVLSRHGELNGRSLVHASDGLWMDRAGKSLDRRTALRRSSRL